ncbi:MAG: hypothetical protein H7329_04635, partial [Opitutaceae bacterium]|nr:hypothetical protein [Cytophagales bacterium]
MEKIIPPINPNTPGSSVANLQFALLFLFGKKVFKANQPPNSPTEEELSQLAKLINREKNSSSYGEGTTKLVQTFQVQQGLGDSLGGMVEEKTAAKLNELLASLGAFRNTDIVSLVKGTVTQANGAPVSGVFVQVFDKDLRSEELLGETITGRDGKYEINWRQNQLIGSDKNEADILMKVFSRGNRTLLFSSDFDAIRFNAAPLEIIDITIKNATEPETIEFDHLLSEVSFHAREVAIADLQENTDHLDISFLFRETNLNFEKIEHLVVAHRLEQFSKIEAAFFYALLRKDTLLKNDFGQVFNSRISIGIHTEVQPLLFDAALADPKILLADVDSAAKEMIVSSKVPKESKRNIELLQEYKNKAEEYYKNEHPKKIVEAVTKLVSGNKIKKALNLFEQNKNDLPGFLDKISDRSFFDPEDKADEKINNALGKLLGFGNEIIPNIIKSKKITKAEDIRKLARLNKKEWVAELNNAKTKSETEAGDKKTMNLYASAIVRKMEKAYPTTAFMAQLEREKKLIFQNQENILSFLSKHEDFDLVKDNIDLFLKDKKVGEKASETISDELKSVQRIFKLVPRYPETKALLKENIHSAQSIVAVGESRFIKEIAPKAGIKTKEAKEIFKRAANTNTAAMLIAGELLDTMRAMDIASLETSSLALKLEAVSKDFPNLKSLFKLIDTCACEHCCSVYSPAAYLVEILQFLDKRSVTDLTVTPQFTSNIAKDVLFKRRPDLGDIDLGCENANIPVKYIDLVCELLEEAIAPDADIDYTGDLSDGVDQFQGIISAALFATLQTAVLPVTKKAQVFETEVSSGAADTLPHYLRDKKLVCKIINTGENNYKVFRLRQTLSTAEELVAAPDYVNIAAYDELRNNSFAFKLPFDLNHVEAKAYFSRFDISRAALMQDFQVAANPPDEAIAAEKLGLTHEERNIIVIPKPTMADQQMIWNAPAQWDTPPIAGSVLDYMKRVDHFLEKTGLTFKELGVLLALKFIDKDGNLFIKHADLSCDTAKKEIANLNETSLDRIHRFLRLQKKIGWKLEVMDASITQPKLGNGLLDD